MYANKQLKLLLMSHCVYMTSPSVGTLLLVRLHQRVMDYGRQLRTESCSIAWHCISDLSLLKADALVQSCEQLAILAIRTHDL